jgi:hypothetical protein
VNEDDDGEHSAHNREDFTVKFHKGRIVYVLLCSFPVLREKAFDFHWINRSGSLKALLKRKRAVLAMSVVIVQLEPACPASSLGEFINISLLLSFSYCSSLSFEQILTHFRFKRSELKKTNNQKIERFRASQNTDTCKGKYS